jgi:NAD(P)H-dependent flavin oxidoreductase YrpB (nitropropane dioxygenase family)
MIEPYLPVLYDEGVPIFVAGLAVPEKHVADMKRRGMLVMVMTGKVQHAVRAESAGADAVAAQGTEAGGHTGTIGGLALVPQVVDAVSIPVVAAGGIVDGRGLVAALALGAQGAIVGTRFIATPEATAAREYREALVSARQDETVRTRCYSGKPLRSLMNPYIAEWEADPSRIKPFPEQLIFSKAGLLALINVLALEVAGSGVKVNGVLPTTIDTPANRQSMPNADPNQWVKPEAIAALLVFLASDEADALNGALIPIGSS